MRSDNPSGADNQQERPNSLDWLDRIPRDLGHWVAGFVDGEGSFNVPLIERVIVREITQRVLSGQHLLPVGIRDVLEMRRPMNRGGKRRYLEDEVLQILKNWESSEAIRRAPSEKPDG